MVRETAETNVFNRKNTFGNGTKGNYHHNCGVVPVVATLTGSETIASYAQDGHTGAMRRSRQPTVWSVNLYRFTFAVSCNFRIALI